MLLRLRTGSIWINFLSVSQYNVETHVTFLRLRRRTGLFLRLRRRIFLFHFGDFSVFSMHVAFEAKVSWWLLLEQIAPNFKDIYTVGKRRLRAFQRCKYFWNQPQSAQVTAIQKSAHLNAQTIVSLKYTRKYASPETHKISAASHKKSETFVKTVRLNFIMWDVAQNDPVRRRKHKKSGTYIEVWFIVYSDF